MKREERIQEIECEREGCSTQNIAYHLQILEI